jgi:hypothetical protein
MKSVNYNTKRFSVIIDFPTNMQVLPSLQHIKSDDWFITALFHSDLLTVQWPSVDEIV